MRRWRLVTTETVENKPSSHSSSPCGRCHTSCGRQVQASRHVGSVCATNHCTNVHKWMWRCALVCNSSARKLPNRHGRQHLRHSNKHKITHTEHTAHLTVKNVMMTLDLSLGSLHDAMVRANIQKHPCFQNVCDIITNDNLCVNICWGKSHVF